MVSVFLYEDFRTFLNDEFRARTARNPKYSIRAFARDLNVSFSRLSEVISKSQGISLSTSHKMASALKMSDTEKEYFQHLIISKYHRSGEMRNVAQEKINHIKKSRLVVSLREKYSDLISKWYYLPLIELLTIKDTPDLVSIAKTLEITPSELTAATNFLLNLGHIAKASDGSWKKTKPFLKIESSTPSKSIRNFHAKFLQTAENALHHQPIEKRKYLSTVFAIKKENVESARKELEAFNQKFLEKFISEEGADTVYCFSMQLFNLEKASHE